MSVSFNQVPGNLRAPIVTAEFDPSQATTGPGLLSYRAILIGQKTGDGSAEANKLYRVTNADRVRELAGRGSILHRMAIAWFTANTSTECWIGVLEDDAGGAAASGSIEVTSAPTEDGTLVLYLGGVRITVGVEDGDSTEDVAQAIQQEIDDNEDLPVTASVDISTVTVDFRHDGDVGNDFDIRHSFRDGEDLPAGLELTITEMSGGSSNPGLDDLIAEMGDEWFHIWAHPYTDSASLDTLEDELASRFGPQRMIDGVAVTSAKGSHSDLSSLGDGRNSPHSVIMGQPGENPLTPPMEFAAEAAGQIAFHGADDPARPFQTLSLRHAMPPAESDRFTYEERNLLLFDSISTTYVDSGGVVRIGRAITTYQENAAGAEDTAYLDVTTMLTLMYLRFDWTNRVRTRYPRHKLASDGARFGPGQAVVTPRLMKAEALSWYRAMEEIGLVENFDMFKENLVMSRNSQDPNRLDAELPPDLINQLVVSANKIAFRL